MATGLASELAPTAHAGALRLPLLWMAVLIAAAIGLRGAIARRRARKGPPPTLSRRLGQFTIPIGLDVLAGGFDRSGGAAVRGVAAAATVVAWASTAVLVARTAQLLARRRGHAGVGGVVFLAPAALLADAAGVVPMVGWSSASTGDALAWTAIAALASGAVGYFSVLVLVAVRFTRSHVVEQGWSSWWIGAGCGGLGAAATGRVGALAPFAASAAARHGFAWTALGFWAAGSAVLVPVLAGSVRSAARTPKLERVPPWTPTFSTGVYALGAGALARLGDATVFSAVATAAAVAMLSMWTLTALGHLAAAGSRPHGSRPDPC